MCFSRPQHPLTESRTNCGVSSRLRPPGVLVDAQAAARKQAAQSSCEVKHAPSETAARYLPIQCLLPPAAAALAGDARPTGLPRPAPPQTAASSSAATNSDLIASSSCLGVGEGAKAAACSTRGGGVGGRCRPSRLGWGPAAGSIVLLVINLATTAAGCANCSALREAP